MAGSLVTFSQVQMLHLARLQILEVLSKDCPDPASRDVTDSTAILTAQEHKTELDNDLMHSSDGGLEGL